MGPESDFVILIKKLLEKFKEEQDAEMYALCKAAEYQHDALKKMAASKMWQQLPAVASEAYTTANEIAQKVLPNLNLEEKDGTTDTEPVEEEKPTQLPN